MRWTLFLCLLVALPGCGEPVPEELKNLVPVKITVLKDGKPLEGVRISLDNDEKTTLHVRRGMTDASGVATIETVLRSRFGKGARPGTYVVTLRASVPFPKELQEKDNEMELSEPERAALEAKRQDFLSKNQIVPPALSSEKTSPLRLDVAEKTGAALTVDVAEY